MTRSAPQRPGLRAVVMRGGTTRGVFFHARDLPADPQARDRCLLAVIGASDPRQVDGLGGADLLLSKVAIVWPSDRAETDVECLFGTITPGSQRVKFGANCGNLSSAVALFAREEGLVGAHAERVRMHNPDSGATMEATVRPADAAFRARFATTSGMPATGELVELTFLDPAATAGDRLLPTGRVTDTLHLPGGRAVTASIVDAGAQYVFLRADDVDLPARADTSALQSDTALQELCEHLRGQAAVLTGRVANAADARAVTPAVPKLAFVGPPAAYRTEGRGVEVGAHDVDLVSRIVSSQSFHRAYAVTGAIATTAAAAVPGSVVAHAAGSAAGSTTASPPGTGVRRLRIGHPTGIIECTLAASMRGGEVVIERATILRTARRIMEGRVFVEDSPG